jgi:iron complex outermembrane receptor protein
MMVAAGGAQAALAAAADSVIATSEGAQLEEIVVTAQKRAENVQNVPISVSTISAAQLAQAGVEELTDLRVVVPGLQVVNANGILNTSLRGIGSNAVAPGFENPVAIYVDGVYYASAVANYLNLANIAQVDVLKGPQGTLFGRNATGGLMQITTRTPAQKTELDASLSYGNYDTSAATFYLGGGIAPHLAADFSVYASRQGDGWGHNLSTGGTVYTQDYNITARSKWIFDPTEDTKFTLIGDYSSSSDTLNVPTVQPGTISGFTPQLGVTPDRGYDVADDAPAFKKGFSAGGSLLAQQNVGSVALSSTTAYRNSSYSNSFELDGGPLPIAYATYTWPDHQFSEELQIQSKSSSPFTWQAGLYYFDGTSSYEPITLHAEYIGTNISIANKQSTQSVAGYAQGTYQFAEGTSLTLGGRYTSESRKAFDGSTSVFIVPFNLALPPDVAPDAKATFDKFNYRISLDHRFNDEFLAYLSSTSGFKSGGFNTGSPGTAEYQPETVTAYEIGLKSDLLDHRMRWNNAAYFYDYNDLQTQVLTTSGVISIANAASARVYGLDSDLQARVTESFRLNAAIAYIHATYESYPTALLSNPAGGVPSVVGSAKGNYLPYAPQVSGSLGGDNTWTVPFGSINLAANAYYNHGYYFEADNVIHQGAFVDLASNLKWTSTDEHWWVSVYGKNLLDKRLIGYATSQDNGTHLLEWAAPRTYGVTVGTSFH